MKSLEDVTNQDGHFDTYDGCDFFMRHGACTHPTAIVTLSPLDGPSSLRILECWAGKEPPDLEDFERYCTTVHIPADHTLLMSAHMPHAGGEHVGRRAHAIIAGPSYPTSKEAQSTYWLKPRASSPEL